MDKSTRSLVFLLILALVSSIFGSYYYNAHKAKTDRHIPSIYIGNALNSIDSVFIQSPPVKGRICISFDSAAKQPGDSLSCLGKAIDFEVRRFRKLYSGNEKIVNHLQDIETDSLLFLSLLLQRHLIITEICHMDSHARSIKMKENALISSPPRKKKQLPIFQSILSIILLYGGLSLNQRITSKVRFRIVLVSLLTVTTFLISWDIFQEDASLFRDIAIPAIVGSFFFLLNLLTKKIEKKSEPIHRKSDNLIN